MAPVYADHPFPLIPSPKYANIKAGQPTDLFDKCATEMACVHNLMVRNLNAIYLQAPHILPADEHNFLNFARIWYELLHTHHTGEEEGFFPMIEALAGEKGMMEGNVEQHHAFHDPLTAFHEYVEACYAGKDKYDGGKIVGLIDAFGPTLMQHLADEIPTISGLRRFGSEKMKDLPKRFDEEGEKNMVSFFPHDDADTFGLLGAWRLTCGTRQIEDLWLQEAGCHVDRAGRPLRGGRARRLPAHAGPYQLSSPQCRLLVRQWHGQVWRL
jgi:hypothetical protein